MKLSSLVKMGFIRCFMCVFVTTKFTPKKDTYKEKRKELKHVNIKKNHQITMKDSKGKRK